MAVTGLVDVLGEHLLQVRGEPAHLVVMTEVVPTKCPQIEKQPDTERALVTVSLFTMIKGNVKNIFDIRGQN